MPISGDGADRRYRRSDPLGIRRVQVAHPQTAEEDQIQRAVDVDSEPEIAGRYGIVRASTVPDPWNEASRLPEPNPPFG